MKNFFSIACFILFFILLAASVLAAETINSFTGKIQINKDGTIKVVETIIYDFGESESRGIFREIPYIYKNQDGKEFELGFNVEMVTDENGDEYVYKVSKDGQNLVIRIGKEDVFITGIHTYVVTYTVSGAIRYFTDHDELYWNVTGNNWNVPIEKSNHRITLNFNNNKRPQADCFDDCNIDIIDNSNINITATRSFAPGEGLTFAVSFPKNLVSVLEPKEVVNFWNTLIGKLTLIFLLILGFLYYFVSPFIIFILWWLYGRDPKTSTPVRAWFSPPKDSHGVSLKPAEVGTLVDEHADSKDISATIIDLAIRGFIIIKEQKKGKLYQLTKTGKETKGLNKFENMLFDGLFVTKDSISTDDLKKSFYKTSTKVQDELYEDLVKRGFFPKNPKKVRDKYYILGTIAFTTFNLFLGIMLFVFGRIMPRKTIFGAVSQNTSIGLKNFLGSQERQLEFQAKNWHMFEKLLPYAIVFGVEKIWAERFQEINMKPPNWYQGIDNTSFNSYIFVNNLAGATSNFSSISTPPSSSTSSSGFSSGFSGGSSGGGFGGGGGGSW